MIDYCLVCFTEIIPEIGWNSLIAKVKKQTICENCKLKLEEINGDTCLICNRPLNQLDPQFVQEKICLDCVRWEEDSFWKGCLTSNQSLFIYNEFLQEVIARFKFRGDYILSGIFKEYLLQKLQALKYDCLVPIPLSQERLLERGFNQAEAILIEAGLPPTKLLKRIHSEKQSKKSRLERIRSKQVFQLESCNVEGKHILLVDDIYTTGTTLRHAAKLFKDQGASNVHSITIARG